MALERQLRFNSETIKFEQSIDEEKIECWEKLKQQLQKKN